MAERQRWNEIFISLDEFLNNLKITSREDGVISLGPHLYGTQRKALADIKAGLKDGIHNFPILKGRQEGISTLTLALDLFWAFLFSGLQGAIITDTEVNREGFRSIVTGYLETLPKAYRVGVKVHNRNQLIFANGSVLNYLVAGTRGTGRLGRGKGLNFIHATEMSSWASEEDIVSLMASLAETWENRLYIFESTARGFNKWQEIWEDAADAMTQKRIFLGWWLKETNTIAKRDRRFRKFFDGTYSDYEAEQIAKVKNLYGYEISDEQVAWYRWKFAEEIKSESRMNEEFPFTEEEAFIMSGAKFFAPKMLSEGMNHARKQKYKGYRYHVGEDFFAMQIEQVGNPKFATLRIWEEPNPRGLYAVGADPAVGESEWSGDLFAIQILRCYADRVVQVAEFADTDLIPYQFAWILGHLLGYYKNVWLNLEVNGPGSTVFQGLRHLRQLMNTTAKIETKERGLTNIFDNVRQYLWHRPDSMGAQYAYHTKTNQDLKRQIFIQVKDALSTHSLEVKSVKAYEEMHTIIREGGWIGADGTKKDDRTMALALAVRHWIDWIRTPMMQKGQTFAAEMQADIERANGKDFTVGQWMVQDFFKTQDQKRKLAQMRQGGALITVSRR